MKAAAHAAEAHPVERAKNATKKAKAIWAWSGGRGHEVVDCRVLRFACPYLEEKPAEAHPAKKAMKKAKAVGLMGIEGVTK